MLPQEFLNRMEALLKEEYSAFLESYEDENRHSLRINPLKCSGNTDKQTMPFGLTQVPWEENGYYYDSDAKPGKHPYHDAGVYYIQEASAMAPVHYLDPKPGERILDLCAAPGGKTTQIAATMHGKGILVCNEIHPLRAKILSENVERMGIRNALVLNETPDKLSERFVNYFDRILVDAPCSGEGMFRKNDDACDEWSLQNVKQCATRQAQILDAAAGMLKPGGRLVYSTCTFSPEENEGSISRFVERNPGFCIERVELLDNMAKGRREWIDNPAEGIENTIRLWPHKINGEGHYLAVLKKAGQTAEGYTGFGSFGNGQGLKEKECAEFAEFKQECLKCDLQGVYLSFGEQLYLAPEGLPSLHKLKVLRPGLHLGTVKKNRFEPSHALALALSVSDVRHHIDLDSNGQDIRSYLNGMTMSLEGEKGWYLVCTDGYSIGWGKLAGGILKNHYPKGLRKSSNCI